MIKHLLFLLLTYSLIVFAQDKPSPVLIEHNFIIQDTTRSEIISYRIPYKNLLFTKNGDSYNASFSFSFEFYKEDEFIKREILNPQFTVNDYDMTLSGEYSYQGFYLIDLLPGDYTLKPVLSLGSTDLEYKIPDHNISVDSVDANSILGPIIIENVKPNNKNEFVLANYGNSIPFSPKKYNILFGFKGMTDSLEMNVIQNGETVYSETVFSNASGNLEIGRNINNIELKITDSSDYNYYILSGFSHLLYEGQFMVKFELSGEEKSFSLKTAWIDKPRVLNNPEYSIKLLTYIESENIVGELLSSDEEDYYKNLTEYWIKNYPADGMKYNYAMEEYYSRSDHAIENFSSLNAMDGAERDRGKIYILYGPPTSIERNYTEMNEILEIWKYDNLARKFIFKDVNGTGKFDLTN